MKRISGASRATARLIRKYPIPMIGLAIFVVASAALLTDLPGVFVADARFEIYWGTRNYLHAHLHLWDGIRNFGRPTPYFSPIVGIAVAGLRWLGASPAVAERLLHAAMIAIAGSGAAAVSGYFRPRSAATRWIVAFGFAFAPTVSEFLVPSGLFLHYAISPWLAVALLRGTVGRPRALLEDGAEAVTPKQRWAAAGLFGLCIFALGALNAASLIYATFPMLVMAVTLTVLSSSITFRSTIGWLLRAGLLGLACGATAMLVLVANLPVVGANLATTELPRMVARFSSWGESWRGLGSWLTYFLGGGAAAGRASPLITSQLWIAGTWMVPLLAAAVIFFARRRDRLIPAALVVAGLIAMVGIFSNAIDAPWTSWLNWAYENIGAVRSLRNGYKASASLALGHALLLGMAVDGLSWRFARSHQIGKRLRLGPLPRPRAIACSVGALCVLVGAGPFVTRTIYAPRQTTLSVPTYWRDAINYLNNADDPGRVLVVPGTNRSRYRWGYVGDDIFDALLRRPHVVRSSLPQGTAESADLAFALDAYATAADLQPGVFSEIARRAGITTLVIRNDLDWETLDIPRPAALNLLRADPGLRKINTFGVPGRNVVSRRMTQMVGEASLAPVEIYEVLGATAIGVDTRKPIIAEGSASAWPALARAGLFASNGPIGYVAGFTPDQVISYAESKSPIVVTDSNRRRSRRVTAERNYVSQTMALSDDGGERPPVPPFAGELDETAVDFGPASNIVASAYGPPGEQFPTSARPALAFDANPRTSWSISGQQDYVGHWIRVDMDKATAVKRIVFQQLRRPADDPTITRLDVRYDDARTITYTLNPGLTQIDAPQPQRFRSFEFRINTTAGSHPSGVGFSEISLIGADGKRLPTEETVTTPARLTTIANDHPDATAVLAQQTQYLFQRSTQNTPLDEEVDVRRLFDTLAPTTYAAKMTLRASLATPDIVLDSIRNQAFGAYGSTIFRNDIEGSTGYNVLDGKPATRWRVQPRTGETLTLRVPDDVLPKSLVVRTPGQSDEKTSGLKSFTVTGFQSATASDGSTTETQVFETPAQTIKPSCVLTTGLGSPQCLTETEVDLPDQPANRLVITLREITVRGSGIGQNPVEIADVAINKIWNRQNGQPRRAPTDCVDLLRIDGKPIGFHIDPMAATLLAARTDKRPWQPTVAVEPCADVRLEAGSHVLSSTLASEGLADIIQLIPKDGVAASESAQTSAATATLESRDGSAVGIRVDTPSDAIVTIGTSYGPGWIGGVDGEPPVAATPWNAQSGWHVSSGDHELLASYGPQRWYLASLAITALGVAFSAFLLVPLPGLTRVTRRRMRSRDDDRVSAPVTEQDADT